MGGQKILRLLEATSVILFLIQAMRVIFSVLFGIIYDQVFAGSPDAWLVVSNLLVLAVFLAPLVAGGQTGRFWLAACALVAALARLGLSVNDAGLRFWCSLLLIAAGGVYLALLYKKGWPFVLPSLALALALDQLLRLAGQTYDISLRLGWLPAQVVWALVLIVISFWLAHQPLAGEHPAPRFSAGLGMGGLLFLELSLLGLPNGIARWSALNYTPVALALMALTLAWAFLVLNNNRLGRWLESLARRLLLAGLMPACLLLAYFVSGWPAGLALLLAQGLALLALSYLITTRSPSGNYSGVWLAGAMLFYLLLNYSNAFAFTYPYALPQMRGLGWLVYLAAGLVGGLAVLVNPARWESGRVRLAGPLWLAGSGLLIWLVCLALLWPRSAGGLPKTGNLRIATYNIHYGYDAYWHFTLEDIAQTIAASGADVVALQEVDTGRLTSYAVDDAWYLSRRLGMNVLYLPTVEHLTGIALLYRGEALERDSRLLTSLQEQTGIVHVALDTGGAQPLHAFGIWMGLSDEDTLTQIKEALQFIGERNPAVLGGDFNAELGSPVASAVKAAGFVDPFEALNINPIPLTDPAIDPTARIDFVWVRGVTPSQAHVLPSLASDHRMVMIEIER